MKKMKKVLAGLLATTMVMSMSVTAWAEEASATYADMSTVTVTKTYNATNTDTTSPVETFNFSALTCTDVKDAGVGVTKENALVPTITSVTYSAGEAGSDTKEKDITITLPEYTAVGVYTYTFKEIAGNTAGVEYYGKDITLVVTVIEKDGKVRVAAVHTETPIDTNNTSGNKSDDFVNTYSAGSLEVSKTVTGLLGDQDKDFNVTVTFTAPANKIVKEAISYVDGTETKTISNTEWYKEVDEEGNETGNVIATAVITLKHNETVTFTNIPYDVTYTVVEDSYTGEGYDEAAYNFGDAEKKINSEKDTVGITNNKGGTVDTGIILDSAPYILLLALAAMGVFAVVNKKREEEF